MRYTAAFASLNAPRAALAAYAAAAILTGTPCRAADVSPSALIGLAGFGWVDDTVRLEKQLRYAASWGYQDFAYAFNAPFLGDPGAAWWRRDSASGWRWALADGSRPGLVRAREWVMAGIRSRVSVAERSGLGFIPAFGPWGWGGALTYVDPASAAGVWYDIRLPASRRDAFVLRSRDSLGAVESAGQWGEPGGGAALPFGKDGRLGDGAITRKTPGAYAANFTLKPGRDAWWNLSLDADPTPRGMPGDSVHLRVYLFQGTETHPLSTKLVSHSARALSAGPGILAAGFFSKAGETYLADVEVRTAAKGGASVRLRKARMAEGMPPRNRLIDASVYESAGPGGLSVLDRMAASGQPGEKELYTRVSSRKRGWEDVRYFQLDSASREAAWDSLDGVRGHFHDQGVDPVRHPVDPLAPATRQMLHAMVDAAAEALGRKPERYLLGGDEVFSWGSARFARAPYAGLDRGALMAAVLLLRVREIDSLFAARYPADTTDIAYIVYGDMLGAMHGLGEHTLGAVVALGAAGLRPGKLLIAPWYYDTHVRESAPFYRRFGFPDSLSEAARFESLLRRDAAAYREAGLDFLGIYSTDGPSASRADELAGAKAWASVCRDFRDGTRGRCRGMLYAGWDTDLKSDWGNAYNGLIATAWYGWLGGAAGATGVARATATTPPLPSVDPLLDVDGDGVLDALKSWRHGPVPHASKRTAKAAVKSPAKAPAKAKITPAPKPAPKPSPKP